MKSAISIPDEVLQEAELLAERRSMSRSELYTNAMRQIPIAKEIGNPNRAMRFIDVTLLPYVIPLHPTGGQSSVF